MASRDHHLEAGYQLHSQMIHANTVISSQSREMQLSTDLRIDAKGKTNTLLHQADDISACLLSTPFLTSSLFKK